MRDHRSRGGQRLRRRDTMTMAGGFAASFALNGCGDDPNPAGIDGGMAIADAGMAIADAVADGDGMCTVYPEQTAGPFFSDLDLMRADISEGLPGAPLTLRLTVVLADGCAPLSGVAVDVWHCDAAGVYSGYPNQPGGIDATGQTFLRGTQVTGSEGTVSFHTIYPGWYPGRTTHMHFRVNRDATLSALSQLYFPDEISQQVYATAPYQTRGNKDTSNQADTSLRSSASLPLARVVPVGAGYLATLRIAIAERR